MKQRNIEKCLHIWLTCHQCLSLPVLIRNSKSNGPQVRLWWLRVWNLSKCNPLRLNKWPIFLLVTVISPDSWQTNVKVTWVSTYAAHSNHRSTNAGYISWHLHVRRKSEESINRTVWHKSVAAADSQSVNIRNQSKCIFFLIFGLKLKYLNPLLFSLYLPKMTDSLSISAIPKCLAVKTLPVRKLSESSADATREIVQCRLVAAVFGRSYLHIGYEISVRIHSSQ